MPGTVLSRAVILSSFERGNDADKRVDRSYGRAAKPRRGSLREKVADDSR